MQTWVSGCGRYTVRLERTFLREAVSAAKKHFPRETGSALAGRYSERGGIARVIRTAPTPEDSVRARFTFVRGMQGLREFFAGLFAATSGRIHYVGEWHSHPGGEPLPSPTDDTNMMAIARDDRAKCPECILVILGIGKEEHWGVFVYSRSRGRIPLRIK